MKAFVDLRPLRENRTFRRLWLSGTASGFGGQLGAFAVVFYVWERTRSALMVGLVGLATGLPLIVLALVGSAFADHVDRRRLALRCTATQILVSAGMAVVAFTGAGGVPAMLTLVAVQSGVGAIRAGLGYAVRTPAVRGALLADLAATLFAMPIALFPVINAERYGGRPEVLGLFTTALAAGGVAASALSGLTTRWHRPGRVLLACGSVWATALGLVGVTVALPLALGLIAVAGAADTWAVVARGTVVQGAKPDEYRGRVSSFETIAGSAGPQLGSLRAGLVASATSGGVALAIGGATALVATALIAAGTPSLRRFSVTDEAKVSA